MGTPRNLSKLAENTDSSGVLGIASGGTGGSTAAAAKSALNLHTVATSGSYADLNNKPTTANITENTNLYYTDARARAAVSVSGSLSYNSTTGVFSYTTPSTSDITEGTNLYYTDARVRASVSAGTNLSYNSTTGVFSTTLTQYSDALARAAVSASGSLSYNSTTGVFSYTTPSTSGIAEGSNLYYTDARARAALSAGTGLSYNSTTGAISSTITQYTDALARAAVSAGTGLSYNSTTGVFTNNITQYTDALAVSANTSAIATAKSEAIASAATDATNKANAAQAAAIAAVTNGAGAAFDTLKEIQDAMATDAELAAAIAAITVGNATQTIAAGTGLSGGGSFTANQTAASTVTLGLGTAGTSGTYTKVTTDAYGRVTSGTTLSSGDIPSLSGLYLPLTGGTLTGKVTFPSAIANRPQMPNGFLGLDTGDGDFDIWGISRDYYPSNPTAGDAWGIRWDGTSNQIRFIGGGSVRVAFDLDDGTTQINSNTVLHAGNYNSYSPTLTGTGASGTWNISITGSAATATDNTKLPLAGGTLTGAFTVNNALSTFSKNAASGANEVAKFINSGGGYSSRIYIGANPGADWLIGKDCYGAGNDRFQIGSWNGYAYIDIAYNTTAGTINFPNNGGLTVNSNTILHSGNYSSYALPLSGGTMSGAITTPAGTAIYIGNQNVGTSSRLIINWHSDGDYNYLIGKRAGTWTQPMDIAFYTGLRYHAHNAYGGHKFYTTGYDGTLSFSVGDGDSNVRVFNTLFIGGNTALHAGNYSSYALPLSGGTMSGTLSFQQPVGLGFANGQYIRDNGGGGLIISSGAAINLNGTFVSASGNSIKQGNDLARPLASWGSTGATGMVIFKLPGSSGNYGMVHMVFDIYEYNGNSVSTVIVGGHNWASSWYNTGANVIGQLGKQVRLGYKDGQYCVVFGDASSYWEYGTIVFRKIHNGAYYSNIMDLGAAISVEFTATESFSNIGGDLRALRTPASFNAGGAITQAGNQVLHASNYSSYALPLTGGSLTGALSAVSGLRSYYSDHIAGDGYGIRFWESNAYKISMGVSSLYQYGTVTDYSIKMQMDNGSPGRGFTWGRESYAPVAALNATSGNFQTAGQMYVQGAQIASGALTVRAGGASGVGWGTGLNIGDSSNYSGFIQDAGISRWRNTGSGGYDWFNSATTQIMALSNSGYLGVGQASDASYRIIASGHIYANANGNVYAEGRHYSRHGTGTFYESLTTGNYSSYALPLSGGSITGNLTINNSSPTIYMRDTDHRSAMIHVNSNVFYVLRGSGTNSDSWSTLNGYWPMELNLETNNAAFGGSISSVGNTVLHAGNFSSYSHSIATSDSRYSRKDTTSQWIKPYYEYGNYLTSETPSTLKDQMGGGGLRVDFLNPSYTGSGGWNHVITWSGYNMYNMYQLGGHYDGGTGTDLWVRSEANHGGTSWTAWRRILNSSNYNSYSPTLTGGGASGTWNITASNLASDTSTRFKVITFTGEGYDSGNGSLPTSYGIYQQGGGWSHPYPDLCIGFHTGIKIGAYFGYNGTRFYNNSDWATEIFSVGNGDNNVRVINTLYSYAYRGNGNVAGTGEAVYAPAGVYSTGTNWLYGTIITNGNGIDAGGASCTLTATRANRANGNFYIDDNYGNGVVGVYASTRYQGVFFMGDSYKMSADGTSLANMYGIGWSHPNAGGAAGNLTDHGMLIINNGGFRCAISNSIVASANITAYSDERLKTNWRSMPENFVARLAQVRVGIYDRIDEKEMSQVGVSAQSFQELLPQAIMTAKDEMGTLSVSYGNAALASAVELAKEVVDLKTRVAQLEALINKLVKE